jgi:hypothetical protein
VPVAAWAGLQLHGDGAWAPFARRSRRGVRTATNLALLVAAVLLVFLVERWRRVRRRQGDAPAAAR